MLRVDARVDRRHQLAGTVDQRPGGRRADVGQGPLRAEQRVAVQGADLVVGVQGADLVVDLGPGDPRIGAQLGQRLPGRAVGHLHPLDARQGQVAVVVDARVAQELGMLGRAHAGLASDDEGRRGRRGRDGEAGGRGGRSDRERSAQRGDDRHRRDIGRRHA
jgi:hypothetical protein